MEEQDINLDDAKGIVGKMRSLFYGSVTKWLYAAIAIPASIIAYNIIMALHKAGFFESFAETVSDVVDDIQHLSYECPALIHDFDKFMGCLGF